MVACGMKMPKAVVKVVWPMIKDDEGDTYPYFEEAFVYKTCIDGETSIGCMRGSRSEWTAKALKIVKDTRPIGSTSDVWLSDCPFSSGVESIKEVDVTFET